MVPVMIFTEGRCGGNDQVYANGTGQLSQAGDRHFHFFACRHDQVGELIDHQNNEWQVLMSFSGLSLRAANFIIFPRIFRQPAFSTSRTGYPFQYTTRSMGITFLVSVMIDVFIGQRPENASRSCGKYSIPLFGIDQYKLQL